jgi:hypothetical protein
MDAAQPKSVRDLDGEFAVETRWFPGSPRGSVMGELPTRRRPFARNPKRPSEWIVGSLNLITQLWRVTWI